MTLKPFIMLLFALAFAVCEAKVPEVLAPEATAPAASAMVERSVNASDIVDENEIAPDFTLPDINGGDFTLSSLRGQYVILDFWGTWCGWCVKGMPKMKEYYEKYHGKFEVVGVDCGDVTAKWKAAVQILKLPWVNVQVGRDNGVSRLYNVKSFPTKVIIDPSGTIVKIVRGEDPKFYTLLDSMFK